MLYGRSRVRISARQERGPLYVDTVVHSQRILYTRKMIKPDHYQSRYPEFCVSWCLLHVRIEFFPRIRRRFCVLQTPYICCILHIRFNRIFSEYTGRMKNTRKEIFSFTSVLNLIGKYLEKSDLGDRLYKIK